MGPRRQDDERHHHGDGAADRDLEDALAGDARGPAPIALGTRIRIAAVTGAMRKRPSIAATTPRGASATARATAIPIGSACGMR